MPQLETRAFELRQQGARTLTGIAMRYGNVANMLLGGERFESGAFGNVEAADVILNFQHERPRPLARTGGGGLTLLNDQRRLLMRAELPNTTDADDALELVKTKVLRGFSIEFFAREEHFEGRVRVVTQADLVGLALVDRPAYSDSTPALRALGLVSEEEARQLFEQSQGARPPEPQKRRRRIWH